MRNEEFVMIVTYDSKFLEKKGPNQMPWLPEEQKK